MPLHVWYDSRLEGQSFLLNASAYGGREKLKSAPCRDFFCQKPGHPPPLKKKNYCSTRAALQMICLGPCDLHNTHSCWCDASQIRKSPQKNQRWWKPSAFAQLAGRVEGKGEGGLLLLPLPPTPSLVQSSGPPLGLQASSLSPLFSCLRFWLSLTRSVARPLALSTLFFSFSPPTLYPSPSGSRSLPGA